MDLTRVGGEPLIDRNESMQDLSRGTISRPYRFDSAVPIPRNLDNPYKADETMQPSLMFQTRNDEAYNRNMSQ